MANIDPQVQIRIIDLAEKWAGEFDKGASREAAIVSYAKYFEQAYKAIIKTVAEK